MMTPEQRQEFVAAWQRAKIFLAEDGRLGIEMDQPAWLGPACPDALKEEAMAEMIRLGRDDGRVQSLIEKRRPK